MKANELPKAYDFNATEGRIYKMWEEGGYFKPSNDPHKPGFDPHIKPFVISIPPPNVTGELHLGHVLFVAMEDMMIRYQRMKGVPSLWVPGSDHAGIATQLQVEKQLRKEGTSREEIGREEFERRTWEWKHKYGGIITNQIRRIGASCDWERERFTLDEGLSKAVREAFVRLYEKGLIYRGPRLINWSPGLKTAVSDLEVEYNEEQGTLYFFKYMLAESDSGEFIPVATTRPETILGDSAVAVHPEDERYQAFVGRQVIVPMLGRIIPVIADEYVTREFGTGALKITPGHDPNDYEIGMRHNLPVISMLDKEAHVTDAGGPYAGMDRFDCRTKLWADMQAAGLVIKEKPYTMSIPRSQRGGEIVEPMISTQWFVDIKPLAKAAIEAVRDGRIKIIPERFEKVYFNWMENIRDWCISRQLWWGHRIPVWYCEECGEQTCAREDPSECAHCGSSKLTQDEDVLDTWFSSGLWPFSTLGWPEETPDYNYFYPTTMMETGYDILFFWVARMIMDGLEFTGKVPFETVYLHGLIRDEAGRKMSKSYGNSIDPLPVMDEMGTDALRFSLLVGSTPGNDTNVSLKKVEANRNFANKVWNAGRFVISAINSLEETSGEVALKADWTLADSWIWARLQELVRDVERLFQSHQYGEAGRQIYDFFWSEFADLYVEYAAKRQLKDRGYRSYLTVETLARVLDTSLRLLHPFTPFVTEELWGHLRQALLDSPLRNLCADWSDALIIAKWPQTRPEEDWEAKALKNFLVLEEIGNTIRNWRAENDIKPNQRIRAIIVGEKYRSILEKNSNFLTSSSSLDESGINFINHLDSKLENYDVVVSSGMEIYLLKPDIVNYIENMIRLDKELTQTKSHVSRLKKLLSSEFANKAPESVVAKEREKLDSYQKSMDMIMSQLGINNLINIEVIPQEFKPKLEMIGISSTDNLLLEGSTPIGRSDISNSTGINDKLILEWVKHADMFRIKGIGDEYLDLLEEIGVDTIDKLAESKVSDLLEKMAEVNSKKKIVRMLPSSNQVIGWIKQARKLPQRVSL